MLWFRQQPDPHLKQVFEVLVELVYSLYGDLHLYRHGKNFVGKVHFHENSWTDWHEFENLADFEDKKIDASKLDPMIVLNVDSAAVETTARLFVPAVSVKFCHTL